MLRKKAEMIFLNKEDYRKFKYTKVEVPITLNECPSDHEDSRYSFEVNCESLCQQNCYIGAQKIEQIDVQRIRKAKSEGKFTSPQWNTEMAIAEVKTEDEVIEILNELCYVFSLACCKSHSLFQYSGISGFSFRSMDIKRSYATADGNFGDVDFNHRSVAVQMHALSTLQENVFMLPKAEKSRSELLRKLDNAFLTAMKSSDAVSRYILLYYLFEIMYDADEYRNLKNACEANNTGVKKDANKKRSELLCQYLQREFGITAYNNFSEQFDITPDILCEIIITRNDLTHRADTSKISKMMYHHMIPILQCVLKS